MILKILTSGDSESLVAEVGRDLVQLQVFIGSKVATRDFGANHEAPGFVLPGLFPFSANIPIVLLIRPMKLEELGTLFAEMGGLTAQGLLDRSSQVMTLLFNLLYFASGQRFLLSSSVSSPDTPKYF